MAGTLYLVATPIGNLSDISPRAAETFGKVDFIAAEDTRVSLKLLNHLGIKKPLISYYEHNRTDSGEKIISRLLSGESCALISDAGTPAISDPGEDLVAQCAAAGINVIIIPGPCAAICALTLSALPTGRFTFEGFLSTAKKSRFEHLNELKKERRTMIFYEAPHKLLATLNDMLFVFGDRRISLSRELTKLYEETQRLLLSEACRYYSEHTPRGEFVLVIEGAPADLSEEITLEKALDTVASYMEAGLSLRDAVKDASSNTGFPKNVLYDAALKSSNNND